MVIEEAGQVLSNLVLKVGELALILQAIGVVVIIWIIFQIVNFIFNKKRAKVIGELKIQVSRIEKKLNKIEKLIHKKK
jgi:biopolymer transport protein ExbB/TolQ